MPNWLASDSSTNSCVYGLSTVLICSCCETCRWNRTSLSVLSKRFFIVDRTENTNERSHQRARCSVFARLLAIGRRQRVLPSTTCASCIEHCFPPYTHRLDRRRASFFLLLLLLRRLLLTHAFNHDAELQCCAVRNDALSCVHGLEFLSTGESDTGPRRRSRFSVL